MNRKNSATPFLHDPHTFKSDNMLWYFPRSFGEILLRFSEASASVFGSNNTCGISCGCQGTSQSFPMTSHAKKKMQIK